MAKATEQIQYETDDPNRIQDVGWTFKEVWRRTRGFVVTSVNLIIFFILWEVVTTYGNINSLFLPKASAMFQELWVGMTTRAPEGAVFSGSILDHFLHSFTNLMTGLAIAMAIGIPGGLLMGGNKYVESILSPYVWALASLPRIALVPLFILFLGFTVTIYIGTDFWRMGFSIYTFILFILFLFVGEGVIHSLLPKFSFSSSPFLRG